MEELTYEELRRIEARERQSPLSRIPENFGELAAALLEKHKGGEADSLRVHDNVFRILNYVHSRRREKIMAAAANSLVGVQLPVEMIQGEREFCERMISLLRSDEEQHRRTLANGKKGETAAGSAAAADGSRPLRIMQDIEEFVGLDGKTYGPFRNSDRVELPAREAETLIKMRIAKISEV